MMIPLLLFIMTLEPIDSVTLQTEMYSIGIYDDTMYCAPFTGTSIFYIAESSRIVPITFTDNVGYRIYGFAVTPFALYLNNGMAIDRVYRATGMSEPLYKARDISTFGITPSEEIILSDREKRELIFLDFAHGVRYRKTDIAVRDMCLFQGLLYLLTFDKVITCDEYGNILETEDVPCPCDRIFVDASGILLVASSDQSLHRLRESWEKIRLPHGVRDVSGDDTHVVMLDEYGTTLYLYTKSDF